MAKPNKKVRTAMYANEVSQFQLANELGIGVGTIMRRLSTELPEETQDRIIELVEKIASGSFSGNLPQLILEDLDYDREMAERQRGVETTDTSLFEKPASSKQLIYYAKLVNKCLSNGIKPVSYGRNTSKRVNAAITSMKTKLGMHEYEFNEYGQLMDRNTGEVIEE